MTGLGAYSAIRTLVRTLAAKGILDDAELRQLVNDLMADAEAWEKDTRGLSLGTHLDLSIDYPARLQELAGGIVEDMEKARPE